MVLGNIGIAISKFGNFSTRMQNGRVIPAAKRLTDLRQRMIGQLLGQGHGHLPRPRDTSITPLGENIGNFYIVILGNGSLNVVNTDLSILYGEQVAK